ncbi:hypothetical protein [Nocardia sp. NPDC051981]|uniref:hypothetical protein n=1 Tax=Nocardia sp. NPDC051981 TaxID=3155417 RepID=UPI00341CC132
MGRRLAVLGKPSRRALAAAAVIGPEFDVAALAGILDSPVPSVRALLRPAYETGLLDEHRERPGVFCFSHGLLRDAVLARIPVAERTATHSAIASGRAAALPTSPYEEVIANGLRARYEASNDPAAGVASQFVDIMTTALRGDRDDMLARARRMLETFPPPQTVSDPTHFFHPRVYCWMGLMEARRGDRAAAEECCRMSLELPRTRGDVFHILAARLTFVEVYGVLGVTEGTAGAAAAVHAELRDHRPADHHHGLRSEARQRRRAGVRLLTPVETGSVSTGRRQVRVGPT